MAYSKAVEKILKKKKISVGDRVRVEKKGVLFEGLLLPRPEIGGDANCLALKLDSGYNAGVCFERGLKIEKLKEEKPLVAPKKVVEKKGLPSLPKISLISTGGTISSRLDYRTGGAHAALSPEEILATAPEVFEIVRLKNYLMPFQMMSEDIGCKEWAEIARLAARELNEGAEGIIITQGTDMLCYTAAALSFMLCGLSKPIAVVGAQRSSDRGSFDGRMNLLCAAHYAKSDFAEVAVVMHGSSNDDYCFAHRGTKCRKMHSSRRDAFQSINAQPLAKIWPNGEIKVLDENHRKRGKEKGKVVADTVFEPRVALLKAYPHSPPEIIDFLVEKKIRGIVIEGSALGHVPTEPRDAKRSWIPSIKRAIDAGVVVAMTTQCLYGIVHPFVYTNLRRVSSLGVVYCTDLLSETAFVKLGWLLGHDYSVSEVKKKMLENYAGEFNPRLTEKEFLS